MLAHEELSRAGVLVYANKQDVKGSMSASEISKELDLTSIKQQQWHIQSCCALTGEGYVFLLLLVLCLYKLCDSRLYQGLEWIANRLKKK